MVIGLPFMLVCSQLNPVTTDEDLELIFSRFGDIKRCDIIKDHKTGDSLQCVHCSLIVFLTFAIV